MNNNRLEIEVLTFEVDPKEQARALEDCKAKAFDVLGDSLNEDNLVDFMKEMCPDCVKLHLDHDETEEMLTRNPKTRNTRRVIKVDNIDDILETKEGRAAVYLYHYPAWIIVAEKYEDFMCRLDSLESENIVRLEKG